MTSKEYFEVPGRYKNWSYGLIGVGILALYSWLPHVWNR
jgi:hypothetical protein